MNPTLDLILGADALRAPLTGIGRYTFELARRLVQRDEVARLRYFSMGRWVADPLAGLDAPDGEAVAAPADRGRAPPASLRTRLATSPLAVRLYAACSPRLLGWRLRDQGRSIYHAPNYIVPPFPGAAVSTVHDLSHILCPQFHPRARVDYLNLTLGPSLARTAHVITVSEAVRQELLARALMPPERVTAIHLAADAVFRPHTPAMLAPAMQALGLRAGRYSLFVGTVEPRKNIARLIEAYARLSRDLRLTWPLVLVGGPGWHSEAIHARMAQAQAEGWLRYLSFIDQRWLPAVYAGARLLAYPSLYEGFGLPIVEAMACGTPVLTSNASCMPEVAGGAAHLVDPLDVEDLAHGLARCLEDEAWLVQARTQGLARAAALSWDRCADETVAVYRQLS
ncbi:glycosyltransferase family 4 protein [Comamonas serinivorans]|uniref:glycosyltransferase family 4 protein n=1 Tax=Comamonas serinivorans TaxID=1082851 RepID=UPI0012F76CE0|nr:glycosyltransferase family 1 protein [Comamonas serinivorans]